MTNELRLHYSDMRYRSISTVGHNPTKLHKKNHTK